METQWSEEFAKIFATLSASNPNDYWKLRLVDRLPTDATAQSALETRSTHSTHSVDSNGKEEELPDPPELSQEVSSIDQCEELPIPPEFGADYDEVEIANAHIYPTASSPSPLPPPLLPPHESKEELINLPSEILTVDESVSGNNPIPTDASSVNIETTTDESLITVVAGMNEPQKNSFVSKEEFQNEMGIDVQIITAWDVPEETLQEEIAPQSLEPYANTIQTSEQVGNYIIL